MEEGVGGGGGGVPGRRGVAGGGGGWWGGAAGGAEVVLELVAVGGAELDAGGVAAQHWIAMVWMVGVLEMEWATVGRNSQVRHPHQRASNVQHLENQDSIELTNSSNV